MPSSINRLCNRILSFLDLSPKIEVTIPGPDEFPPKDSIVTSLSLSNTNYTDDCESIWLRVVRPNLAGYSHDWTFSCSKYGEIEPFLDDYRFLQKVRDKEISFISGTHLLCRLAKKDELYTEDNKGFIIRYVESIAQPEIKGEQL